MATRKSLPWPLEGSEVFGPVSARPGWVSAGGEVRLIQEALGVKDSGAFDEPTRRAVVAYQAEHNLPISGTVDRKTWARLTRGVEPIE